MTKMASLHLTATETHRRRVIQMGEDPARVINVGAPGVEDLADFELPSRQATLEMLGLPEGALYLLVTFHPATTDPQPSAAQVVALIEALDAHKELCVVVTSPNADPDNSAIARAFDRYAAANPARVRLFTSLGRTRYLAALAHSAACVGNSSSGLYEAPSFGVPTVDIGSRQEGRERAKSVLWAPPVASAISDSIGTALDPEFAERASKVSNPYHREGTAAAIVAAIRDFLASPVRAKTFHDIPIGE